MNAIISALALLIACPIALGQVHVAKWAQCVDAAGELAATYSLNGDIVVYRLGEPEPWSRISIGDVAGQDCFWTTDSLALHQTSTGYRLGVTGDPLDGESLPRLLLFDSQDGKEWRLAFNGDLGAIMGNDEHQIVKRHGRSFGGGIAINDAWAVIATEGGVGVCVLRWPSDGQVSLVEYRTNWWDRMPDQTDRPSRVAADSVTLDGNDLWLVSRDFDLEGPLRGLLVRVRLTRSGTQLLSWSSGVSDDGLGVRVSKARDSVFVAGDTYNASVTARRLAPQDGANAVVLQEECVVSQDADTGLGSAVDDRTWAYVRCAEGREIVVEDLARGVQYKLPMPDLADHGEKVVLDDMAVSSNLLVLLFNFEGQDQTGVVLLENPVNRDAAAPARQAID